MMLNYTVSLEISGRFTIIGTISGSSYRDAEFSYLKSYIDSAEARGISISLPITEKPFSSAQTRSFFEGLIPEGYSRRFLAQRMHLDENDYLSILYNLGNECIGALRITTEDDNNSASYETVSKDQIRQLASEGASKSFELVAKSHLSLAGASGKVGLYYDKTNDRWYLPKGLAPSTHIVKQSHVRLDSIVLNEKLCMLCASKCGLLVPESFIINTGNGKDDEVLFATERYDRSFSEENRYIDGLAVPQRLHQEDVSQALGIASSDKYEVPGDHYLKGMFDLIRSVSADPITDLSALWDAIVFDCLIGNTDAHIKNFSLLYSPDLKAIRLAPFYDIISTAIYDGSRNMAFNIGGEYSIDRITDDCFIRAAGEAGLGKRYALQRVRRMKELFRPSLISAAEELSAEGFPEAKKIAERILISK